MKKLLSLLLCFLLLFAVGCKEKTPEPTTYVEDGITQSTLSYIEEAYFKDGTIYVTHVSSIGNPIHENNLPYTERWVNDKWVQWSLFDEPLRTLGGGSGKMPVEYPIGRSPVGAAGRYRLSWGYRQQKEDKDGNIYYVYEPDTTYLVCYVTIPEEGEYTSSYPPTPTLEASFVKAGEEVQLQMILQNNTEKKFEIHQERGYWWFEYYTEEEGFDIPLPVVHCEFPKGLVILPGESYTCTLPLLYSSGKAAKSMKEGRYRIVCGGIWGEGEAEPCAYFDWEEA